MIHQGGMCRRSWLDIVALVVCVAVLTTEGCSPPIGGYQPPTLEYKMFDSDVVAWGVTTKTIPDPSFPDGGVYSVEFQVYCIFKGEPLPETIKINHVGHVPGLCIATNMTRGVPLSVYLRRNGDEFEPNYREDPGSQMFLDELTVLCETVISYPTGRDANNHEMECPEPYDYEDCVPTPVKTSRPLPPPTLPPSPPTPRENPSSSMKKMKMPPSDPEAEYMSEKLENSSPSSASEVFLMSFARRMDALPAHIQAVIRIQIATIFFSAENRLPRYSSNSLPTRG